MWVLGSVGFSAPLVLAGLLVLPVLWWLLRAVPPAPVRRLFPGVALLIGLEDADSESDRTPWWLLLIRLAALAAMIVGFAGPVLNPEPPDPAADDLPLLIYVEDSWAAAPDWGQRMDAIGAALEQAGRAGRRVALVRASAPGRPRFQAAGNIAGTLAGISPVAWDIDLVPSLTALDELGRAQILWLSDGLARTGRAALLELFEAAGPVRVLEPPAARLALRPARFADGVVDITVLRSRAAAGARDLVVLGHGPGPQGAERELARLPLAFEGDALTASATLSLPPELRNRLTRFAIEGQASAGAVSLTDDSLRRRRVGLIGPAGLREGLELLSPLYYLNRALEPTAELIGGDIAEMIQAGADVIVLADVAAIAPATEESLREWIAKGGLLLRFAGPHLAARDKGRGLDDPLLPVRLRAGGRVVGGAMSWGAPRGLAPFPATSPFYGLAVPEEVTVSAQVLAEPDPELADLTIAALADGTPLVTRRKLGAGEVVLFHVTANAEWSNLPLSGLFVSMLERLAVSTRPERPAPEDLVGTRWAPVSVLDGFGSLHPAGALAPVPGEALAGPAGPALPPGLYTNEARRLAVNVIGADTALAAADWPARVTPQWGETTPARNLSGWLWLAALALLGIDIIAALWLTGRMPHRSGRGGRGATAALVIGALVLLAAAGTPGALRAQAGGQGEAPDDTLSEALITAAGQVTLAHILTGNAEVDQVAQAGLVGLSDELFRRTSVEPATPMGIDPETDELSVYPLIYWPIAADQKMPSPQAYRRLNAYLRAGGMLLIDTRDAQVAGFGAARTPEAQRLRVLAAPLDIPPLEPVPKDHVLTRAFYLLTDFPGRFDRGQVWVEAAPPDAEQAPGMPFRNLNDGVTPVVIGGNDWASAWAVTRDGSYMLPVGRGRAGERQREMAYRFGINLVMHVLTGNYKSDQVHVPALLERLSQ